MQQVTRLGLLAGRRPSSAYSLVELLVVLGIVALLTSLTLGAAFTVRSRVNCFRCVTNLTQLGVATRLYIADWGAIPLVFYGGGGGGMIGNTVLPPARPPSPPPDHDVKMVLGDYVSDLDLFYCPVVHVNRIGDPITYHFNEQAAGYRLSQVRSPHSRALIMADPFCYHSGWRKWHAHACKANALFLDGHVKGYRWINWQDLQDPAPLPIDWTPSHPTEW